MKLFMGVAVMSLVASSAFAKSEKVCFGSGDAKGSQFVLTLTTKTAVISDSSAKNGTQDPINGAEGNEGKYPANGSVDGRDGKTYLSYHMFDEEGGTDLLVDESLLQPGAKGLAKIRWRGESFSETVYFCRDQN